jgi:type II secretory pathway component GspD/PulD (secretin)
VKNTDGQPAPKPRADVKVERLVYAVRGGSAKELANALSFSFKDEGAFQVFPDAGSNSLLLSGPEPVLDEATKILREIDRPARAVHVEVFFLEPKADGGEGEKDLEPAGLTGPLAEVTARIRDLQRRGVLAGLKRVQVTALERQPAQVKVVESRPFVTGVSGTRTGLATRSVTYRDSGTTVEVTPQVGADGTATLQLRAEDSRMQTPEANPTLGPDEKGEAVKAANFVTATFEGPVRVRLGQAVLAQGLRSTAKAGEGQVLIVVAAAEEPAPRDKK